MRHVEEYKKRNDSENQPPNPPPNPPPSGGPDGSGGRKRKSPEDDPMNRERTLT